MSYYCFRRGGKGITTKMVVCQGPCRNYKKIKSEQESLTLERKFCERTVEEKVL